MCVWWDGWGRLCVFIHTYAHGGQDRGQLLGTDSFLPLWGCQGLNAGVRHGSNGFNPPRQRVDSGLCISGVTLVLKNCWIYWHRFWKIISSFNICRVHINDIDLRVTNVLCSLSLSCFLFLSLSLPVSVSLALSLKKPGYRFIHFIDFLKDPTTLLLLFSSTTPDSSSSLFTVSYLDLICSVFQGWGEKGLPPPTAPPPHGPFLLWPPSAASALCTSSENLCFLVYAGFKISWHFSFGCLLLSTVYCFVFF